MQAITLSQLIERLNNATDKFYNRVEEINKSNHFPVSDFDTGDNMYYTLKNALNSNDKGLTLPELFVMHSQGNSGIILGQALRGFFEIVISNDGIHDSLQLIHALKNAQTAAYGAVLYPKEGTMLTFIRSMASFTEWNINKQTLIQRILQSLNLTVKNGDFDAGAKGLYYLLNYTMELNLPNLPEPNEEQDRNEITHKYCTELLCELFDSSINLDSYVKFLNSCGDYINYSVVKNTLKLHVHTNDPFHIFEHTLKIGKLVYKKVDNMLLESKTRPSITVIADMNENEELFPDIECEYISLSSNNGDKELEHKILSAPYSSKVILLTDNPQNFQSASNYSHLHVVKTNGFISRFTALTCKSDWCDFECYLQNVKDASSVCQSMQLTTSEALNWLEKHPEGSIFGGGNQEGLFFKNIYGVIII